MNFFTLDWKGSLLAIVVGIALFFLGLGIGYFFVLEMVVFLVLSAIVTRVGQGYKKRIGTYQKYRGLKNVIANGLPALVFAIIFYHYSLVGGWNAAMLAVIGFTGAVAAISADKFESELGVFGGTPRMVFHFRRVKRGTSGGISVLGLVCGIFATLIIALLMITVIPQLDAIKSAYAPTQLALVTSVILGGILGSVVDTFLGFFEEKGIGNKFTTNALGSLAGGIIAMLIFAAIA
ncbi:MAG: DUF92 domain-containing protein [Candidatus Micrarchaeota archaeon]|nr:DUF92 domain-containing protein [Candidatus Micrarchaeota archaeon]